MMQLRYQDFDDFIVVNKGFGLRTHRVSGIQFGLVEYLSEKLAHNFFVVHRLDKETSGLILFAKNKEAAQKIADMFENHQIKKSYLFLTDRSCAEQNFEVEIYIDKVNNQFVQKEGLKPNSKTGFEFIKQLGKFFLWRARPETGKPHQIRLHAEKSKIPILGDCTHNGSPFYRLALHAETLVFDYAEKNYVLNSEVPDLFLEPSENQYKYLLKACFEKRQAFFKLPAGESYRLVHTESERLRADIFDDHLWIYDYSEKGLSPEEKKSCAEFAKAQKFKIIIRHMLDRGGGVGGLEKTTLDSAGDLKSWQAQEEQTNYVLKLDAGFSPGLFLDQRENRKLVKNESASRNVLNLFCYTAGFSVSAALGNATQVTSVDVSSKFLNWSKENFIANSLDPKNHEFFAQDCLLFLKGSVKRNRKWDLIICDPPTFGRSKDSIWKLERDLPELAELLLACLENNGKLLFTCNYEKMNRDELIQLFVKNLKNKPKIERLPQLSLDYELTDDLQNLMKGFWLTKN